MTHSVQKPYRWPSTRHWGRKQEKLEMDALKRFSLALMAAVVVAGATPAFSQTRDTRPTEPDRPRIDRSDHDGSSGDADEPEATTAPRITAGIGCMVDQRDGDKLEAKLVNATGKAIPAGTVITVYIQPGNIQQHYKLPKDWGPGFALRVSLDANDVQLPAFCSVRVGSLQPVHDGMENAGPRPDKTPPSKPPYKPRETPPTLVPFKPGDAGAFDQDFPLTGEYGFTCQIVEGGTLITNTGTMTIKEDSRLTWHVPGHYSASWYVWDDIPPGESFFLPDPPGPAPDWSKTRVGALCDSKEVEPPEQP